MVPTLMENTTMAKLTDAQTSTLLRGAQHVGGFISSAAKTPMHMALAQAKKLAVLGLVQEAPCFHDEPFYSRDEETGDCVGYRLTAAGFEALGIDQSEWPAYCTQDPDADEEPAGSMYAGLPQCGENEMPAAWRAPAESDATLDAREHALLRDDARREAEDELANPEPIDSEGCGGVDEPEPWTQHFDSMARKMAVGSAADLAASMAAQEPDTGAHGGDAAQAGAQDQGGAEAAQAAPTATTKGTLRGAAEALRDAAAAVLVKWDDRDLQYGLDAAIENLRAALALVEKPAKPAREAGAERAPREGTKQQRVIDMLRAEGGASNAQIQDATSWAPHSVRGFLAALKKKGFDVRSTKEGSEMIYRIAA